MSSYPVRTPAAVVAALVGALALGACGGQHVDGTDPGPEPVEPQQATVATSDGAAAAAAAAREAARADAKRLRELRQLYPTAGLEVPPDTLVANVTDDGATDDGAPLLGGWMLRTAE